MDAEHRNLLAAVLQRAVEDFQGGDQYPLEGNECGCEHGQHKRCPNPRSFEIVPAWRWIADASMDAWGFGWVCHNLGISPDSVQAKLYGGANFNWVNSLGRAHGDPGPLTVAVRATLR